VEFTSLVERAEARGLQLAGFTDQHHFMVGLAARYFREFDQAPPPAQTMRAFKTLMHPGLLGRTFQALALKKNLPAHVALTGFQFGVEPRAALGLKDSPTSISDC